MTKQLTQLSSWQNLTMARHVSMFPFRSRSQREKVNLLHPCLHCCGNPSTNTCCRVRLYMAHNGSYPNTQTHQGVSLFWQVLTLFITSWADTSLCIVKIGGRCHSLLNSHIIGSLGDIWINCLLLLPRQSKLYIQVVWLRLLVNKRANHAMHNVPPVLVKHMW